MEASSQLPQKSWVLQVAREGGFNSNGDWKGACWQTKCGFQIGGRGRQTKKKSADLRDPTLFFFLFPEDAGKWLLPPLSLRACLRLSEMTKQRRTVGFLRLLPLIHISSPKQRSVVKVRQGFQGISGDSGEILFISEHSAFSFPIISLPGFLMTFLEHSESVVLYRLQWLWISQR